MLFLGAPRAAAGARWEWVSWSGILLLLFLGLDVILLSIFGFGDDWAPLWVAGRLAWSDPISAYNFQLVSSLQAPLVGEVADRPFVYPPSALLFFVPLSLMPFGLSLALISIGSALWLARVASSEETDRILLLLAPPVVLAAIAGQPTLLVAALAITAFMKLKSNPAAAGVLLGVAAMVKPPLLLLAPVGLLAGGHWRAVASGAATAAFVALASILLFGTGSWFAWLDALPRFRELFTSFDPLVRNAVTPYALGLRFGIASDWLIIAILPVVVLVTVAAFVRSRDPYTQAVVVVGGSLLATPYAMHYELAALAPAVLARSRSSVTSLAVPFVWAAALFANLSLIGLLAVYLRSVADLIRSRASIRDDRSMEGGVDIAPRENDHGSGVPVRLAG